MKQILSLGCAALCAILISACGGGGSPAFIQPAGTLMTPFPIQSPTQTPIVAPTPSSAPVNATPVPLSQRAIAGAPLAATISQLSRIRTQAHAQAQGTMNGLPILVESSGTFAINAGTFVNWVTSVTDGKDVPQTSGTVTATGGLQLNNPGFSQACVGSLAAACIIHPTAWEFGTSSAQAKPLGKQTLTIAFGDGTTAQTVDDVYDSWGLGCNQGWAYIGGAVVIQATRATSDVYADCVAGNIVFTQGAIVMASPAQDQYGRYETVFPTLTAAFIENSLFANAPMPSIAQGEVFGIITRDGGFAKVYFTSGAGPAAVISAEGMALHSNLDGSYPY